MTSNPSALLVCPCCSAPLDFAENPAPDDDGHVECPFCDWEFRTSKSDSVEDDGDIEGETELEIDDDGDMIVPDDERCFPPWHGSARALPAQRGLRGAGEWDNWEPDVRDDEESAQWDADRRGRCLCPSCAHPFRDVWPSQIVCPDCHCHFSLDNEQDLEAREEADWDDDEGLFDEADALDLVPRPPIIVCPRGQGHVRSVQEALRLAAGRRPILLRPGLHESWTSTDMALRIIGDGPREEIVVQVGDRPLIVRHRQAVLCNLTIQGLGRLHRRLHAAIELEAGTIEQCDITSDSVACVRMQGGTLRRCRIHDSEQVGVLAHGGDMEECEVLHNGGAGILIGNGSATVSRCRIHDGHAEGVKIGPDGTGILLDCDIHENALAGVRVEGPRSVLSRCRIHDNGATGVLVSRCGAAELRGCVVSGNARSGLRNNGGGLHVFGSRIHDGHGAGVLTCGSAVTYLRHCLICRNRLGAVRRSIRSRKPVLYKCRLSANGQGG